MDNYRVSGAGGMNSNSGMSGTGVPPMQGAMMPGGATGAPMQGVSAQGVPMQSIPMQGTPMQSGQPMGPQMQSAAGAYPQTGPNGMPMIQQVQAPVVPQKDHSGLIKTIVIIALSLIAVTFIGLFIWMMMERNEAQSDIDSKIAVAEAKAREEQAAKDEEIRLEEEKNPDQPFTGPADYGELSFDYPKTWSVYVAKSAVNGGDFEAYFNPKQVDTVGNDTINALRVTIRTESFEKVAEQYQRDVDNRDANLTMSSVTIGENENITANRYDGKIPGTELIGSIVIFKIRGQTAILRTDSILFEDVFEKILKTVTFNE